MRVAMACLLVGCALAFDLRAQAKLSGEISARSIVELAHRAAGGELWRRPKTLHLLGTATLYTNGDRTAVVSAEHYEMWREFPSFGAGAHDANGKVRIDAKQGKRTLFQIAFDGEETYNQNGRIPGAQASKEWSEAFGFGIIRFALERGFSLQRSPDDELDGQFCWVVKVIDPKKTETTFWIEQRSRQIRRVGFDTPKGWHERTYSEFFTLKNGWVQPGRVRMTYRGVLHSDVRWTKAFVNQAIAADIFRLADAKSSAN
jgi:hypothetical protein